MLQYLFVTLHYSVVEVPPLAPYVHKILISHMNTKSMAVWTMFETEIGHAVKNLYDKVSIQNSSTTISDFKLTY